jgi:hypothetical protein
VSWLPEDLLFPCPVVPDSFHLEASGYASSLHTGDMDSDGDEDIVAVISDHPSLFINLDGMGRSWERRIILNPPGMAEYTISFIEITDMDSDEDLDVILAYGEDEVDGCGKEDFGYLYWLENNGVYTPWTDHLISGSVHRPSGLACADLDGDGDIEVAEAHYYSWYMGGGEWWYDYFIHWFDSSEGLWTSHLICEENSSHLLLADVDMDSDLDVVYAHGTHISCRLNGLPSGSWTYQLLVDSPDGVAALTSADIDGDGDPDMLACGGNGKHIKWFLNPVTPGEIWPETIVADQNYAALHVCCEDLDGDGDLDILGTICRIWKDSRSPSRSYEWTGRIWLNQAAYWIPVTISHVSAESWTVNRQGCAAADIDGDGIANAVFFQFQTGRGIRWIEEPLARDSSCLESAILDLQSRAEWRHGFVEWDWVLPEGTWGEVRVRASSHPLDMGPWSEPLPNHCCLEGIVPDSAAYFQYRLDLGTESGFDIPVFQDLSVCWEEMEMTQHPLLPLDLDVENPSRGRLTVTVSGTLLDVEIGIYDTAGRLVDLQDLSLGDESVTFVVDDLPPGLYLCRAKAGQIEVFGQGILLP